MFDADTLLSGSSSKATDTNNLDGHDPSIGTNPQDLTCFSNQQPPSPTITRSSSGLVQHSHCDNFTSQRSHTTKSKRDTVNEPNVPCKRKKVVKIEKPVASNSKHKILVWRTTHLNQRQQIVKLKKQLKDHEEIVKKHSLDIHKKLDERCNA